MAMITLAGGKENEYVITAPIMFQITDRRQCEEAFTSYFDLTGEQFDVLWHGYLSEKKVGLFVFRPGPRPQLLMIRNKREVPIEESDATVLLMYIHRVQAAKNPILDVLAENRRAFDAYVVERLAPRRQS